MTDKDEGKGFLIPEDWRDEILGAGSHVTASEQVKRFAAEQSDLHSVAKHVTFAGQPVNVVKVDTAVEFVRDVTLIIVEVPNELIERTFSE